MEATDADTSGVGGRQIVAGDSLSADDMVCTMASSDSVYDPTGALFHAAEGGLLYAKYTQGAE
jgi:hypothetical protein